MKLFMCFPIVPEMVDLIPGGSEITVDNKNLPDYLDAQLKYRTMVYSTVMYVCMYVCNALS